VSDNIRTLYFNCKPSSWVSNYYFPLLQLQQIRFNGRLNTLRGSDTAQDNMSDVIICSAVCMP